MKTVTVLTPTYNRVNYLDKVYKSLCAQTNKEFEWIIIDDGSDDCTEELVLSWIEESDFTIVYKKKKNGGKHTALNMGFDIANSKYLIILDSDDTLTEDAVETIIKTWKIHENYHKIGCVVFLKLFSDRSVVGEKFLIDGEITTLFKQRMIGDKAETFRTSILKKYKFPVIPGEKFIGESVVWCNIAKKYKYAFYNKGIYVCEYLEDGLTKSGRALRIKNPKGGMLVNNMKMSCPISKKNKIKSVILYGTYACFSDESTVKCLINSNKSFFSFLLFPISYMIYIKWRKQYGT